MAIKVRMTDAKTIAKHFGDEFVATPGFDGRVLGFAQKDSSGYSLYIENGSPKLAAMATIAHELTHIWQYQNWDEKMILSKYGKQYRLEIYEGMAKWAEIQYLLYLNEISYAKRQEIVTRLRDDEYGRGFIQYAKKYPLAYRHEKNATPFGRIPPYIVKSFFLIFQGIFSSISQMNEPRRWTFLCIWYENRGVGVHKIKRHHFRSTWPCVYPPIYGSEPPVSTRITRISAGS